MDIFQQYGWESVIFPQGLAIERPKQKLYYRYGTKTTYNNIINNNNKKQKDQQKVEQEMNCNCDLKSKSLKIIFQISLGISCREGNILFTSIINALF